MRMRVKVRVRVMLRLRVVVGVMLGAAVEVVALPDWVAEW